MRKLGVWVLVCLGFVFVSTARAQSGSGVNESQLNGNYAFRFSGFSGNSNANSVLSFVGRFTADGAGNVTGGEIDSNSAAGGDVVTAQPFTGSYTIGADHRGSMTVDVGGTMLHWAFAMSASGNAQFIEADATGGSGIVGSGTIERSSGTSSSNATITGDYAFGLAGFDAASERAALVGRWTASGTGTFASAAADINAYGTVGAVTFENPTYTITDSSNGRGTITMPFTFGGSTFTLQFVFYVVNSGRLLVMETDGVSGSTPLLSGTMVDQQIPAGAFSNGLLNGGMVLSLTGRTVCTAGGPSAPDAIVGLVNSNGSGGFTLTYDENCGGPLNSAAGITGTATVAANGRAELSFAGITEIAYLSGTNQLFFLGTDAVVLFGTGEGQSAETFSNGSVAGGYAGAATDAATFGVNIFSGEFAADGASPTGQLTGAVDTGNASGPATGEAFSAIYEISASPTNGRGTVTINSSSGGTAVAYAISPTAFVAVPVGDRNPSVWLFEQAPSSVTAVSLSAVSLNPASVIGGQQNSTGTATLSGAAPSGGATITLSSNNSAGKVPASVAVAAGATTATFAVSTSTVSAPATAMISASYGGTTKTATLTLKPVPLPTVVSLSLNPSSVLGGLEASKGTVMLSAAAPAGGAIVSLSSSNGAASVPSSVFVPSGATSATFTVNTAIVLISTSANITATYNGTSRTATLSVLL